MLTRDEASTGVDRFRRYLRDRRLPVTRQRMAVAEVVLASADHPSVELLRARVNSRGVHVGLATLYRTVDALVKSGTRLGEIIDMYTYEVIEKIDAPFDGYLFLSRYFRRRDYHTTLIKNSAL